MRTFVVNIFPVDDYGNVVESFCVSLEYHEKYSHELGLINGFVSTTTEEMKRNWPDVCVRNSYF